MKFTISKIQANIVYYNEHIAIVQRETQLKKFKL